MFQFISEMSFWGIIFYCVTFASGVAVGVQCVRYERDRDHIFLVKNIIKIMNNDKIYWSDKLTKIRERTDEWERQQSEIK